MRLFVAISLPEDVRDELARLGHGLPGARWVAPENLHLTLRFIGEVDADEAHDIDAALAALPAKPHLLFLGALLLAATPLAPWASATALRQALE